MIVLTVLLVPLAILTAFSVKERVKAFMVLFCFYKWDCWASLCPWT